MNRREDTKNMNVIKTAREGVVMIEPRILADSKRELFGVILTKSVTRNQAMLLNNNKRPRD